MVFIRAPLSSPLKLAALGCSAAPGALLHEAAAQLHRILRPDTAGHDQVPGKDLIKTKWAMHQLISVVT